MRAFAELWDRICRERYGVDDPKLRRFRYGVQVNSLGLTEEQPENNAWRILIETLGVLLSRDARCRALQLPAWNEALSLPRPWDQQWSLRLQQILALETDLLDYPDLFEGSTVVRALQDELIAGRRGGARAHRACRRHARRARVGPDEVGAGRAARPRASRGSRPASRPSSAATATPRRCRRRSSEGADGGSSGDGARRRRDARTGSQRTQASRDDGGGRTPRCARLRDDARAGTNLMPASIACAQARVTTGEWAGALRSVFGEYRPGHRRRRPAAARSSRRGRRRSARRVDELARRRGRRPRMVVGKPGLDGHSNGAEMIAVAARHCGFDVVYSGIRLSAGEIARQAAAEDASVIGISVLSGSHLEITRQLLDDAGRRGRRRDPGRGRRHRPARRRRRPPGDGRAAPSSRRRTTTSSA